MNNQVLESCMVLDISDIKRGMYWIKRGAKDSAGVADGLVYILKRINGNLWLNIEGGNQQILLSEQDIRFGTRVYLTCECGKKANKLYLTPEGKKYKCRGCVSWPYQSTSLNRHSKHGKMLYNTNQMIRLSRIRSKIKRLFHNGQFTHRFRRYLGLCERAGFMSEVNEANKLLTAVNT